MVRQRLRQRTRGWECPCLRVLPLSPCKPLTYITKSAGKCLPTRCSHGGESRQPLPDHQSQLQRPRASPAGPGRAGAGPSWFCGERSLSPVGEPGWGWGVLLQTQMAPSSAPVSVTRKTEEGGDLLQTAGCHGAPRECQGGPGLQPWQRAGPTEACVWGPITP